jgi:hypothetical protein
MSAAAGVQVVPEHLVEPPGQLLGLLRLVLEEVLVELPGQAPAQADESFGVGFEDLPVDPRVVVEPLQEGDAGELDEVLEPGGVLGEQGEVGVSVLLLAAALLPAVPGGQVRLVADDRVDAALLALGVELDRPVQVAVVGDGAGGHAQLLGLLDQLGDAVEAVQQGVVGVQVEVGELAVGHRRPAPIWTNG